MFENTPPVLLALTAAFLFAVGGQWQFIGLRNIDPRSGTMITIATSALIFWAMAPFLLDWSHWTQPAVFIFILAGLFRPSVSANLTVAGIRHLGPTLSSALSATAPIFGAIMGVLWLGETLTWPIAMGTGGVIAAIILLSKKDSREQATWPLWALTIPIGAAAVRSLALVLSKIGMEEIPDPYFAGLVGYSVSAIFTILTQSMRKKSVSIKWRNKSPYWFIAAGLAYGIAVIFLNSALMRGQIVTVVPIISAAPIFSMLLSIFVFRREKLTTRILLAVFLVVPLVTYIALNR